MDVTILRNNKKISTSQNNLAEIQFISLSQYLDDLIGKDSDAYDICLDGSFLDSIKILSGVTYRDILDSETPSFSIYNTNFRRIIFQVEKDHDKYFFKSNGKKVLMIELDIKTEIHKRFIDCIHSTRELLERVAGKKDKNDQSWKELYEKILHNQLDKKEELWAKGIVENWNRDKNLEFSNFEYYAKYKRALKDKEYNWWDVEQSCSKLKPYRNVGSHNRDETIKQGKKNLDKALSNMKELARIFNDDPLWDKFDKDQKVIKDFFDEINGED